MTSSRSAVAASAQATTYIQTTRTEPYVDRSGATVVTNGRVVVYRAAGALQARA